jgi:glycerate-2-kinase
MLEALARKLDAGGFKPLIITNQLEGDASELGVAMAKLLMRLLKTDELTSNEIKRCFGEEGNLLFDKNVFNLYEQLSNYQSDSRQPLALLFGGESTVRFNKEKVQEGAKGGRNQELVLAAFNALLTGMKVFKFLSFKPDFFSLG